MGISCIDPFAGVRAASAPVQDPVARAAPRTARLADFGKQVPSRQAEAVADWVAHSGDHQGRPFAVLDKIGAKLYVFDGTAKLVASSMVLLGSAIGDETLPSVLDKPLWAIDAAERTTPAGRYKTEPGEDLTGQPVLWVDYDASVAMHRVVAGNPKERRFERLASPSAEDKRISNGCINVPVVFFNTVVEPLLGVSHGMIYVLPEVKTLSEALPNFYDVATRGRGSR